MRRTCSIAVAISLALLVMTTLSGCFATQARLANSSQASLDGIVNIVLAFDTDNITVLQGSSDELEIKEFIGQDKSTYYDTIDTEDQTVTVSQGYRPSSAYFAAYTEVYLPSGYTGSITINTSSGQVKVDCGNRLNALAVQTGSGAISVSDVTTGQLSTVSDSGSITISSVSGPVACSSSTGSINATALSGYGSFTSSTGNETVDFKALSGNVDITNNTGKLTVSLPRTCSYRLHTTTQDGITTLPYADGEAQISEQTDTSTSLLFGLPSTGNTVTLTTGSGAILVRYHK